MSIVVSRYLGDLKVMDLKWNETQTFAGNLVWLYGWPHSRLKMSVFAKIYPTCSGHLMVLWTDDRECRHVGCVYLKDTIVAAGTDGQWTFSLRPKATCDYHWQMNLVFQCCSADDYQRWLGAVQQESSSKSSSRVSKMPSLEEED